MIGDLVGALDRFELLEDRKALMKTVADLTAALAALETKRQNATAAAAALEASKEATSADAAALDAAVASIVALEGELDVLIASMAVPSPSPIAIT